MTRPGQNSPRTSDPAEPIADFFDAFAPVYDGWARGVHVRLASRLVTLSAPTPGEDCLDVGCGTGLVANALAPLVGPRGTVVGLDVAPGMLHLARGRARDAGLRNTVYEQERVSHRLRFQDDLFDLVTLGTSLAFLGDPLAFLTEARRVLHDGGRIALSVRRRSLVTPAQETFFGWLEELTEQHWRTIPRPKGSRSPLGEPQTLRRLLLESGFREPVTTMLTTGSQMPSAAAWIDHMTWSGPWPWALLTTLGPTERGRLEAAVGREMERIGDEAFHYKDAFTLAVASTR
jgi:ubiquinone/menaquinone biosynthesis C-methylase UbiE